ncbi:MAG: hypothetical protein ACREH4_01080 [Vitreimonas sp.]
MTTTQTAPDPIADELWRAARAWLAEALREVVSPVEIARTLARKARAAIKRRLARIEILLAKLLLIEAVRHPSWSAGLRPACASESTALARGVTHTHAARCAKSDPDRGACVSLRNPEDPANPETWRVRFSLRIPREHPRVAGGPRVRDLGPALFVRDIWRENTRRALVDRLRRPIPANAQLKARELARRFEAVRRVLVDPRRAIAVLARKLQSLRKRARAFARRIAFARAPRAKPLRATFVNALAHAHYASLKLPSDTS